MLTLMFHFLGGEGTATEWSYGLPPDVTFLEHTNIVFRFLVALFCPNIKSKTKQQPSFPHSYATSHHNSSVFWAVGDNNSCRDKTTKVMHLYSARTIMCLCIHSVPKMPFDLIQGRSSMRLNRDFTRLPSRKEAAAGPLSLFNHGVFVSWLRWSEVTVVGPEQKANFLLNSLKSFQL